MTRFNPLFNINDIINLVPYDMGANPGGGGGGGGREGDMLDRGPGRFIHVKSAPTTDPIG